MLQLGELRIGSMLRLILRFPHQFSFRGGRKRMDKETGERGIVVGEGTLSLNMETRVLLGLCQSWVQPGVDRKFLYKVV